METSKTNPWAIPAAIVIAGALIAASLYWSRTDSSKTEEFAELNNTSQAAEEAVKVAEGDHIRGNPKAKVRIITYTDFECPFCKLFHNTVNEAVKDYGNDIAWIYRNFPIERSHPKAVTESVAAECVADLAGEEAYWKFVDRFFELTPSNNQTDIAILPDIAVGLGIDEQSFRKCVESEDYTELIKAQFTQAIETGARGTPWSLVVTKSGRVLSLDGAQDYAIVKQIIETALAD